MAKRTSIAKQLGLSNDPVQPKEFSREAFRLTPSPARGGGWTPAVAETPTAGNTTIGRLAGALSSVSGLLAQAKAFEDKKLEMEQQGLQIDHQTALVQLQGQGADARSASLAAQMDIAQQQTAEAFELDRLQQMNPEDRKFAASHASEYVEEADQQRKDAQVEMVRADALVPVAQKHPVVKNEIREIFRGNEAAATYFDDLADDLEEWKKGPEGGDGVFTPSEDEFNQYVAQWTQDYKDKLQITANSAAEGAFNTAIADGYNKTLPRYKREVFDYVERASLNDFQQQANLNLDAAYNSTLGGLEGETGEVNYDTLLSAPWWNTIRQKNPDELDGFISQSVLGSIDRALDFGKGGKPLVALKELEKAKIMLGLPDSDKDYKYRGKISFKEGTVGQKLFASIAAAEESIEERELNNTGKPAAVFLSKLQPYLSAFMHNQGTIANTELDILLGNPTTNNIEAIRGMFAPEDVESTHVQELLKEYEEFSFEERIMANESLYSLVEKTRTNQEERLAVAQKVIAPTMKSYSNPNVYATGDDDALAKAMMNILVDEDGQTTVSDDVRAALNDPNVTEGEVRTGEAPLPVVGALSGEQIAVILQKAQSDTALESRQAIDDFVETFAEENGRSPALADFKDQLGPTLVDLSSRGFMEKVHDMVQKQVSEERMRKFRKGETVNLRKITETDAQGASETKQISAPSTARDFYKTVDTAYKSQQKIRADKAKLSGKQKEFTKEDSVQSKRFLEALDEQKGQAELAYEVAEKAVTSNIYDHMTRGTFFPGKGFTQEEYSAAQRGVLDAFETKVEYGISADEAMAYYTSTMVNGSMGRRVLIRSSEDRFNAIHDKIEETGGQDLNRYRERYLEFDKYKKEYRRKFIRQIPTSPTYLKSPNLARGAYADYYTDRLLPDVRATDQDGEIVEGQTLAVKGDPADSTIDIGFLSRIKPPVTDLPVDGVNYNAKGGIKSYNMAVIKSSLDADDKGLNKMARLWGYEDTKEGLKEFLKYQYTHPLFEIRKRAQGK